MVTTQTSGTSLPLKAALLGVCVVVALGAAASVWLLPGSWVEPKVERVNVRPTEGPANQEQWRPIEASEWATLTASFERLREPDRNLPDETGPGREEEELPPVLPPERSVRPPWNYEGFIEEPGGFVAVVRTDSGQRMIYQGDTVIYSDPRGDATVLIVESVGPDTLVLRAGEERFEYDMQRTAARQMPDAARGNRRRGGGGELAPNDAVSPGSLPGKRPGSGEGGAR